MDENTLHSSWSVHDPYDSYGSIWFIYLNYICRSNSSVQIIRINYKLAYLQCKIILKLTKNSGCTNNKAGAPSNTLQLTVVQLFFLFFFISPLCKPRAHPARTETLKTLHNNNNNKVCMCSIEALVFKSLHARIFLFLCCVFHVSTTRRRKGCDGKTCTIIRRTHQWRKWRIQQQ